MDPNFFGGKNFLQALYYFLFSFWLCPMVCGILVHQSGIEPMPPALGSTEAEPLITRGVYQALSLVASTLLQELQNVPESEILKKKWHLILELEMIQIPH